MGFDPSNIIDNPVKVRDDNYYESEPKHKEQKERILVTIGLLKLAGASDVYNYLNKTNGNKELYPLTSIRARITEMNQSINSQIIFVKRDKSVEYNSTESKYKIKEFQNGLF